MQDTATWSNKDIAKQWDDEGKIRGIIIRLDIKADKFEH